MILYSFTCFSGICCVLRSTLHIDEGSLIAYDVGLRIAVDDTDG